jgi:hypothetical protein
MRTTPVYDPPMTAEDARACRNCVKAADWSIWFPIQNGRSGKYHSGGEWGVTDCGIDATEEGWLWPT